MKLHYRDPESGGTVIVNPPDVRAMARNSRRQCATVVLHGNDLVASTVPCSSHGDTLRFAGMSENHFDPLADEPDGKSLRMGLSDAGATCELWCVEDDDGDPDRFPFSLDQMERLYRYILAHPRMKLLASAPDFAIDIVIWNCVQEERWTYDGGGLRDIEKAEASMCPTA